MLTYIYTNVWSCNLTNPGVPLKTYLSGVPCGSSVPISSAPDPLANPHLMVFWFNNSSTLLSILGGIGFVKSARRLPVSCLGSYASEFHFFTVAYLHKHMIRPMKPKAKLWWKLFCWAFGVVISDLAVSTTALWWNQLVSSTFDLRNLWHLLWQ